MNLPQSTEYINNYLDGAYSEIFYNRYANLKTKIDVRSTGKDIFQDSLLFLTQRLS